MEFPRARCSGWVWVLAAVGSLGMLEAGRARDLLAQPVKACDVRSRHFLVHTDLSAAEANELVARLETMLRLISNYWGRPMRGAIECYVVRDLDAYPKVGMDPAGIQAIRSPGGLTLMRTATNGNRYLAKSVVYACARPEVVQHEAVHAYCHHTFGRIGPVWYSEGMAEMGHYWTEGDCAVGVDNREIEFLQQHPPKPLAETLSPTQVSGDCWQNYASRWAFCHFLVHNPNYSPQFAQLGRGLLQGADVSFERTYKAMTREMSFEYLLFLKHIGPGYRVDLCAWDWKREFAGLRPGRMLSATVMAGRGWQPTGLKVNSGTQYEYAAAGAWKVAGNSVAIDADGREDGRGRLVGAILKDYQLGEEFELGVRGSLQTTLCGDLYLRCRNDWSELSGDSGRVAVQFKLPGRGPSLHEAETRKRSLGKPAKAAESLLPP